MRLHTICAHKFYHPPHQNFLDPPLHIKFSNAWTSSLALIKSSPLINFWFRTAFILNFVCTVGNVWNYNLVHLHCNRFFFFFFFLFLYSFLQLSETYSNRLVTQIMIRLSSVTPKHFIRTTKWIYCNVSQGQHQCVHSAPRSSLTGKNFYEWSL